jgi:hypothetical protein
MSIPYEIHAQADEYSFDETHGSKREAIRILHRRMKELGEGAVGFVRLKGFGYIVQQWLRRDPSSGRLRFVNEEL